MTFRYAISLCGCLGLAACDGTAWNTTVADTHVTRLHMLSSVDIGATTETEFVTRWGQPTQKIREGARTEFIYRNMGVIGPEYPMQTGDSQNFVIVTFEHGVAIAARSNEDELCRATFAPRPPGPYFNNPSIIHPVGECSGPVRGETVPSDAFNAGGGSGDGAAGGKGDAGGKL